MSRLALAVCLVLGPSPRAFAQASPPTAHQAPKTAAPVAAPPASAFPPEAEVRPFVRSYVDQYCGVQADRCADARALLAGYEDALGAVQACREKPCSFDVLYQISLQVKKLDLRAAELPFYPRYGHPLLRLSLLASIRLNAQAGELEARDGQKRSLPGVDESSASGIAKAVEKECLEDAALCPDLRTLYSEGMKLFSELAACKAAPCSFEATDLLVRRAGTGAAANASSRSKSTVLFAFLAQDQAEATRQLALLVDQRLLALSAGADKLSARLDALEKNAPDDPQALRRDSDALSEAYREASVGEDRLTFYLGYDKAAKRPAVNAASARLAGLRARALALMAARGLSLPPAADAAAVKPGASGKGAAPRAPQAATLLDARAVPNPAARGAPEAPPILPPTMNPLELMRRLASSDPVDGADVKRRLGQTATVGSPGLYAAQAYTQRFANTCAIATQVQVLRAHGLLPLNADPRAQEKELGDLAIARGFFDDGTPKNYSGELLIERGLLVSKINTGNLQELVEVFRRGHIAQLSVDGRYFWTGKDQSVPLPHAVLVTGLEVDRASGQVLGAYVNDTGTAPPGGGRFEPIEKLAKAMYGDMMEIQ